jgi:hypothetical protein
LDVASQAPIGPCSPSRASSEGFIEADETYIGGYRKGWNGRGAGKVGVAIAAERRGRIAVCVRLAVISRATTAAKLASFSQSMTSASKRAVKRDLGSDHGTVI